MVSVDASRAPAAGLRCWAVTDGKPGMENQCIGLAEAMGLVPEVKRVTLRTPWRQLTPWLKWGVQFAAAPPGDAIAPPWPDVLIASGRQSIAPALAARNGSRGRCFTVVIQDPQIAPANFAALVVPEHDRMSGPNILTTLGAVHRVTPQRLAAEAAAFGPAFEALPRPRIAVLVGGNNGVFTLDGPQMEVLAAQLKLVAQNSGGGLMVTPSRRTGAENEAVLRRALAGLPAFVWDGHGPNPYFAMLAAADAVIATGDSVSMMSEACSTGKPVYAVDLKGGSAKFTAFHDSLRRLGHARPFRGILEDWTPVPLRETQTVAAELLRRLALHRQGLGLDA